MNGSYTASSALRPDADTLQAVRRTCARVMQHPEQFAAAFRENFGASVLGGPAPHPATHEDALRLAETVMTSILEESDPDRLESFWGTSGGERAAWLPSDDLIPAVVKALVRSVREVVGDDWSSMRGSQWAAVQLWVLPYLTTGAGRAKALGHGRPVVEPPTPEDPPEVRWPAPPAAPPEGPDPGSRHRRPRGPVRAVPDGDEWVP